MKAVIEMSSGTGDKTEVDKATGQLFLDRKLSVNIPANYGFIENTLATDGDALDVFVLGPILPGLTKLEVVPVGVFLCKDQGVEDHKILAVPLYYREPQLDKTIQDIALYLNTYKKGFKVICYVNNPLTVLSIYRKSRIRPIYKHSKLSVAMFLGMLLFSGLLFLLDQLLH